MAVFSDLGTCRSIDPLQDMTAWAVGLQLLMVSNGSNVKNKLLLDNENWIEADIQYSTTNWSSDLVRKIQHSC